MHSFCCCLYWSDAYTVNFLHKPHPDVFDIRRRFEADQADFVFLFYVSKRDLYSKIVCMNKGFLVKVKIHHIYYTIVIDLIHFRLYCISMISSEKESNFDVIFDEFVFGITCTTKPFIFRPGTSK